MRTKLTILFLILLAFGVFYGKGQSASVNVPDDCDSDDVDDLEDCINKLEKKISELQGKERTLEKALKRVLTVSEDNKKFSKSESTCR